jgi:hypothetical protein
LHSTQEVAISACGKLCLPVLFLGSETGRKIACKPQG